MKVVDRDAHEHFVSCIRWAPAVVKQQQSQQQQVSEAVNGIGGDSAVRKDDPGGGGMGAAGKESIRCVIATASVDMCVRVFAS